MLDDLTFVKQAFKQNIALQNFTFYFYDNHINNINDLATAFEYQANLQYIYLRAGGNDRLNISAF